MKKRKNRVEIPLWAKPSVLVWVEIRDKSGIDVLEYLPAVIMETLADKGQVRVSFENDQNEDQVDADMVHQRLEEHGIVSNLADIPLLNDAELLKHLEVRYLKDLIYCYCGPTLIAVNPYKACPHEESSERYQEIINCLLEKEVHKAPPHVWTLSATAYDYLFKLRQNQAICISGESGAGKTESTKRCLAFITTLNKQRRSTNFVPIEQKIMACNPILEAFGNAKTFRNDNSSRFGKYTTLYIHKQKKSIKGAAIENYLLEKSRIVKIGPEERNYHIFYAMCRFFPQEKLNQYKLTEEVSSSCSMNEFYFLNQSGVYQTPKVDDNEFYEDVCKAFLDLEFTEEEIDAVWRTLAAILHLGNVKIDKSAFKEGAQSCQIEKNNSWKFLVELLQCDEEMMESALTNKLFQMKGQADKKIPLKPDMVQSFVYSLAKELYNKMFDWIVVKLNKTLLPDNPKDPNFMTIGVLDIFGFEIFDKNSLEQFFINYANERLQALYIQYIFKNECDIFREEGLEKYISLIKFKDNAGLLASLDSAKNPPGVFVLVDQACRMNKDDRYLYDNIKAINKKQEYIAFPKFSKNSFVVKHTARDVEYCVDSFVEKNKDEISSFLEDAIKSCKKAVVDIYIKGSQAKTVQEPETNKKRRGGGSNAKFLGFKFKKDMDNLINQLAKCYCHFIRCIKPNEFKKANHWNSHLALMQVRYMGLLDSLKIRKQSFPFRFEFVRFYELYQDLDFSENGSVSFRELVSKGADFLGLTRSLLDNCGIPMTDEDLLYGKTRIFLNEKFKIELDKELIKIQKNKIQSLKTVSGLYKTFLNRNMVRDFFKKSYNSICISRDLLKGWTAKIEGMRFRNFQKITRKVQSKFRLVQSKRQYRLKSHNMRIIARYLSLYRFSKQVMYIAFYKRKVVMLQAMMDRQIRDGKNRFCRQLVNRVFESAWTIIHARIVEQSVLNLQKSYRAHLLRNRFNNEYVILRKKIKDAIKYNAVVTIQKIVRGFLVRKRLNRLHRAAFKIQGYFRMVWMRNYFLQMSKSARLIQKCYRKYFTKKQRIDQKMDLFLDEYGRYNQEVNDIEHSILFDDVANISNMKNINTYTKLPFFLNDEKIDFGTNNYRKFIPNTPEIELNPKAKFMSLLIDVSINVDTTNIYPNTWAHEFLTFVRKSHRKNNRFLHLEIGETFSLAVTEDREVYSWGLNDFNQCARYGLAGSFSLGAGQVRNLGSNNPRFIGAGKDHGVMVDDFNNVYSWGRNMDGQLGLEHARSSDCIHVLNNLKDQVTNLAVKDNMTFLLTKSGSVIRWPCLKDNSSKYSPQRLSLPPNVCISNISLGSGFGVLQATSGLVFALGRNDYGQLGVGTNRHVHSPVLIQTLKDRNEKVIEIHCGFAHTICRTALNKVYTWGLNNQGQLGHSSLSSNLNQVATPKLLAVPDYKGFRYKPRSISAGLYSSYILMDDRRLFRMGKHGTETVKNPTKFKFVKKFFNGRMADDFTPLKVFCKWSKLMTATYVLFVDFRKCNISKTVREKFVEKINTIWGQNNSQLLPTHDDLMAKHIWYKYLQKPGKHFPPNLGYSGKSRLTAEGRNRLAERDFDSRGSVQSQRTLDLKKSYDYIETGIDWKNKKMLSQETGLEEGGPQINVVEGEDTLHEMSSQGQQSPDRFKRKRPKNDSEEEMVYEYLQDQQAPPRGSKSPTRLSKRSRKMSPGLRSKNNSKYSVQSSQKKSSRASRQGSPSFSNKRDSSQKEGRFKSPSISGRMESPSMKKSNLRKGNSKYEKSSREVKFVEEKNVTVRGSKEILRDIEKLKNKKKLTKDQKRLLKIFEQMS